MSADCKLPSELLFNVLYHSDLGDVVRWRTVSKWFCAITQSDLLWRSMYANATVLRPPGPSPCQSRAYLQRMLVKAVRLADAWPHRLMREVSSTTVTLGRPLPTTTNKLVAGRWLVGCEDARRFVLHDADPGQFQQAKLRVLWERSDPVVSAWHVHTVSPVVGQSLVYVLLELPNSNEAQLKWKLLEFRLHDESGEVYDSATLDPPPWARGPLDRVDLHGGRTRFLSIPTQSPRGVVFDTDTRMFYALPEYRIALAETVLLQFRDSPLIGFRLEFTDTHVISLSYYRQWFYGVGTLIQIYALPDDDAEGLPCIRLTHEGFSDERLHNVSVMKPCVDPAAGTTTIHLLDHTTRYEKLYIMIVDLTLLDTTDTCGGVTPMHVIDLRRVCVPQDDVNTDRYYDKCLYLDARDGKCMRGFLRAIRRRRSSEWFDPIENQYVAKFSIDATRGVVAVTRMDLFKSAWPLERGGLAPAAWKDAVDAGREKTGKDLAFDGLRGKLCYAHPEVEDTVVVVDVE